MDQSDVRLVEEEALVPLEWRSASYSIQIVN